jgi:hypothetical protein
MVTEIDTGETALPESENPTAAFTEWGGLADGEAYARR